MAAAISASMVKDLREKTGAGMMECKKALEQSGGEFDGAVQVLRESGAAKAAKREGRTASEGLVGIAGNSTSAAVVSINCETDFVARNEDFQKTVQAIANAAHESKARDAAALAVVNLPSHGQTVGAVVADMLAKIGEKISLGRAGYVEGDVVATYIHPPGKIGVLVAAKLTGVTNKAAVEETLRDVAMHIAAIAPEFLTESDVDAETIAKEREIAANIAKKDGKPDAIIPKIVEGAVKKFYKENCLLTQQFVKDPKKTIQTVIDETAKAAGGKVELTKFLRFKAGEVAAATTEG